MTTKFRTFDATAGGWTTWTIVFVVLLLIVLGLYIGW